MNILIVDDEPEITSLFKDYLEFGEEHRVTVAHSGPEALQKVRQSKPDLVILDILMGGVTGFEVVQALRANPETAAIPVILSSVTDGPTEEEEKRIGITGFLRKPVDFARLNGLIRGLEGKAGSAATGPAARRGKFTVLVIEDDEEDIDLVTAGLEAQGCAVLAARDGAAGVKMARGERPDLIVLDYMLPNQTGVDVVRELKAHQATAHIPVVIVSAYLSEKDGEKLFVLKDDGASSRFSARDLCKKIQELLPS